MNESGRIHILSRPQAGPWVKDAACKDWPRDLWFAGTYDEEHERFVFTIKDREDANLAKAICESCPVKEPCLEYGLTEKYGIWGGMSERERRRESRKRMRQP